MNKPIRKRLSTEARCTQLLDVTRELILEHGLNSFTMELLARKAGVSNPLVYKYFSTRLVLLQSLLQREFDFFYGSLLTRLNQTDDFVAVVHIFVSINFDQESNGKILPILLNLADVAKVLGTVGPKAQNKVGNILVDSIMKAYGVTRKQARVMAKIASGTSIAAAENFSVVGGNREQTIDSAVQFILGGLETFKR
ncbi:TetR/AcrR family transcriptional regulator [Porticoccaceae bacterium]|jgi:AcrR family transcriptional regulator|nr:TetR/AcrR family transcriptional regulator [Cellvibrionales bacterium]MDA7853631.1 TetR/AcrR family transcriptional regulator [Porticoccaceae bacterium]